MKFKQLGPEDYLKLKPFFDGMKHEHSEYCLPTLLVWINDEFQPNGVIIDDTLLISAEYKTLDCRHLILPISPNKEYSPSELYDLAQNFGFDKYWFVPKSYLDLYDKKEIKQYFSINELKDYRDYIYRVDDLIRLEGNKYSKKRNLINQFHRSHVIPKRVKLEEITSANVPSCIEFLEEWCRLRECDQQADDDMICEKQAAIEMLANLENFESRGLLLKIDNMVNAFGIVSPLTKDMAVLQFEKAFESIKGLYQYFDNECIKKLCHGYTFINKESDMSIPGLKKAKKSYHPVRFVKVYELSVKSTN